MQLLGGVMMFAPLGGCCSSEDPWGTVAGLVTIDGRPVEPATVLFSSRQLGIEMTAETDADGRFSMRTDRIDGLPVGTYKVAVMPRAANVPPAMQDMIFVGPAPQPPPSKIPTLDREVATTRLRAEVQAGTNEFTFNLAP